MFAQHSARWSRPWLVAAALGSATMASACGGAEPAPKPAPTAPTAAPTATATATAEAEPAKPKVRVDFLEAKMSPPLDKPVVVRLDSPGADQTVPMANVKTYPVRFSVGGAKLPDGAYVQLVLDNVPFRPITDLKEKVTLQTLAGEGKELSEGEHILAVYVARPNQEAIRSERGVGVSRFYVGKRAESKYKSRDPLLVVGSPSGSYEGEKSQEILVDFYVVNALLSEKEHSVRMVLKGPGAEGDGMQRLMTEWKPVLVWQADGDYTVEATLLDPQGQPVESPWNPVVRTFKAVPAKK